MIHVPGVTSKSQDHKFPYVNVLKQQKEIYASKNNIGNSLKSKYLHKVLKHAKNNFGDEQIISKSRNVNLREMIELWNEKLEKDVESDVLLENSSLDNDILALPDDSYGAIGESFLRHVTAPNEQAISMDRGYLLFTGDKIGGYSSDAFVELVDLFPTISQLAGLSVPPLCPVDPFKIDFCTEGLSFVPVIYNVTGYHDNSVPSFVNNHLEISKNALSKKPLLTKWKSAVFSQYPRPSERPQNNSDTPKLKEITIMGYSMRTDKYRYTEWARFDHKKFRPNWSDLLGVELYFHEIDPREDYNVASDPMYTDLILELSASLHKGWRYALPTF